jgi:hypothetical protein
MRWDLELGISLLGGSDDHIIGYAENRVSDKKVAV